MHHPVLNPNFPRHAQIPVAGPGHASHFPGVHMFDAHWNTYVGNGAGSSNYAEAVIRGPKVEIPLFNGDDPLNWLKLCERFFEISSTPYDQWENLATAHFLGRTSGWFKGTGIPWQVLNRPQHNCMLCSVVVFLRPIPMKP